MLVPANAEFASAAGGHGRAGFTVVLGLAVVLVLVVATAVLPFAGLVRRVQVSGRALTDAEKTESARKSRRSVVKYISSDLKNLRC